MPLGRAPGARISAVAAAPAPNGCPNTSERGMTSVPGVPHLVEHANDDEHQPNEVECSINPWLFAMQRLRRRRTAVRRRSGARAPQRRHRVILRRAPRRIEQRDRFRPRRPRASNPSSSRNGAAVPRSATAPRAATQASDSIRGIAADHEREHAGGRHGLAAEAGDEERVLRHAVRCRGDRSRASAAPAG